MTAEQRETRVNGASSNGSPVDNRPQFGGLPIRGSSMVGGATVLLELAGANDAVTKAGGRVTSTKDGVITTLRYPKGAIPVIGGASKKQ